MVPAVLVTPLPPDKLREISAGAHSYTHLKFLVVCSCFESDANGNNFSCEVASKM